MSSLNNQIIPLALEYAYTSSLLMKKANEAITSLAGKLQEKEAGLKQTVPGDLVKKAAEAVANFRQLPANYIPEIEKMLEKHAHALEMIAKLADPNNTITNSPFGAVKGQAKEAKEKRSALAIDSPERRTELTGDSTLAAKVLKQLRR